MSDRNIKIYPQASLGLAAVSLVEPQRGMSPERDDRPTLSADDRSGHMTEREIMEALRAQGAVIEEVNGVYRIDIDRSRKGRYRVDEHELTIGDPHGQAETVILPEPPTPDVAATYAALGLAATYTTLGLVGRPGYERTIRLAQKSKRSRRRRA